jgi:hypothetical protein
MGFLSFSKKMPREKIKIGYYHFLLHPLLFIAQQPSDHLTIEYSIYLCTEMIKMIMLDESFRFLRNVTEGKNVESSY